MYYTTNIWIFLHYFLIFNGDIFSYVVSHIEIVNFGTVELK